MSFEKPKFNKPEKKETMGKKMSPEAAEQMLNEMNQYIEGLKAALTEKQAELKKSEKNPKDSAKKIKSLKSEIQELKKQISGLTEFSKEGKEKGTEFFEKEAK